MASWKTPLQARKRLTTMCVRERERWIILTSLIYSTVKVITPHRIVHVHSVNTVATWAIWQARSEWTWRSCRDKFTFSTFKTNLSSFYHFSFRLYVEASWGLMGLFQFLIKQICHKTSRNVRARNYLANAAWPAVCSAGAEV